MSDHGLSKRWPAAVMALLVLSAAAYSFSPRPLPPFPETVVKADGLLLNSIAERGDRMVAVGELGHILIADDPQGPWREAEVSPQRGSTLTRVIFIDDEQLIAVGQDGWILRSTDRGEHWTEVNFEEDITEPLLAISGPHNGRLHAVGGFGLYRISDDLGQTWTASTINTIPDEDAPPVDTSNPFAMMDQGIGDRHLNAFIALQDGRLMLAGESGVLARSDDGGENWEELESIYPGSFFGALALPDNGVLVFGMRGHVFRSLDGGDSWQASEVPEDISLFGGAVQNDGRIVLVGGSDTLIVSEDGGQHFKAMGDGGRSLLADVLPIDGGWLTAGEAGLRVQSSSTPRGGEGS